MLMTFTCYTMRDIHRASPVFRMVAMSIVSTDGLSANFGEWPWQALILSTPKNVGCGGSLIDHEWVVTAAHCLKTVDTIEDIIVVLGEYNWNSAGEPFGKFIRKVKRRKIHQNMSQISVLCLQNMTLLYLSLIRKLFMV